MLFFGIATDLVGSTSAKLNVEENLTVKALKNKLIEIYPKLKSLSSYAVAVNETYATDDLQLQEHDTIAIIPPVSGG